MPAKPHKVRSFVTYLNRNQVMLVLICSIFLGITSYLTISRVYDQETGKRLRTIARAAAMLVDGSKLAALQPGDETSPYFKEVFRKLLKLRNQVGASYIYTLRRLDNGEVTFLVDADPDAVTKINEVYTDPEPEMVQAFEGVTTLNPKPVKDTSVKNTWSRSAYAPIFNSTGQVVAVVGVDLKANQIQSEKRAILWVIVILGAALTLIASWFAIRTSRQLGQPLKLLAARLHEISSSRGDLTQRLDIKTSLKELMELETAANKVQDNSREILLAISRLTESLETISQKLLDSSQTVSANSQEVTALMSEIQIGYRSQATNTTAIARTMEKISGVSSQAVQSTVAAEESTVKSSVAAQEGQKAVAETLASIDQVREFADNFNRLSSDLGLRSEQISRILDLLTGIARQTKVLALNANIEASKAGETGRGFAVVAQQIRGLADTSQHSVDDIALQIEEIQTALQETMTLVQKFYNVAEESGNRIKDTEQRLIEIQERASESREIVQKVADLVQNQVAHTQETTNSIQEIAALGEKFADSSKSVVTASEEQARVLQDVLNVASEIRDIAAKLRQRVRDCKLE